MSHRFGRASYALMHDFWLADRAVGRFRSSPAWDALPVEERDAVLALLFDRLDDARRAVEEHPPWVLTPDAVIDGVAARTGVALEGAMADVLGWPMPDGAFAQIRGRLMDFVAFRATPGGLRRPARRGAPDRGA